MGKHYPSAITGSTRTIEVGFSGRGKTVNLTIEDSRVTDFKQLGITISAESAWDLVDEILASVGERPKPPTNRDIWDALPIGSIVRYVVNGSDNVLLKARGGNYIPVNFGVHLMYGIASSPTFLNDGTLTVIYQPEPVS